MAVINDNAYADGYNAGVADMEKLLRQSTELTALKARQCVGCSHWARSSHFPCDGHCNQLHSSWIKSDFCCAYWEAIEAGEGE